MLEIYIEIFTQVCIQLVAIIPAVFAVYLLFMWIGSLLLDRKG